MPTRRLSLILPLLALPSLWGCGDSAPAGPPPVSDEAMAAVSKEPGIDREKLARAVDSLFADEDAIGETHAVVVIRGGEIVAERYGDGFSKDTRFLGWSMAKTVTGVLIGLLVSDGRLRLNESAPVPRWQRPGDPRGEITLRQLLQMRSGLRHAEVTDPVGDADTVRMLFLDGRDDMSAYAESQPLEAEPGRKFEYSSASTIILADTAAHALTDRRDPAVRRRIVSEYLRTRLFEPAGMTSMVAEFDAAGTMIGSSMIHATARDWGKFGEYLRHGGSVKGAQLIPRGWIDFMKTPGPRNKAYGAQLWLNRPSSEGEDMLFPGKAPEDLFAAIGHLGQYVIVSPGQRLTVVRLGHTEDAKRGALRARLSDLVALFPKS
ncbi:MAG: serine hydrolase [Novosphingobium sp.]|nr:serine hydrolase [Novosphingobium sp.]